MVAAITNALKPQDLRNLIRHLSINQFYTVPLADREFISSEEICQ